MSRGPHWQALIGQQYCPGPRKVQPPGLVDDCTGQGQPPSAAIVVPPSLAALLPTGGLATRPIAQVYVSETWLHVALARPSATQYSQVIALPHMAPLVGTALGHAAPFAIAWDAHAHEDEPAHVGGARLMTAGAQ